MAFKWTAPRTWVAAEKPSAATMNSHIRDNLEALNGFVHKTSDESVTSSTVLQNDNELLWSIPQAGTYVFDLHIYALSAANAAGDIKVGFTFPTGTMHFSGWAPDASLASGVIQPGVWVAKLSAASGTDTFDCGLSTSAIGAHIQGVFIATASGTLQVQWAQLGSSANASTVKAGSFMEIRQVA